MSREDIKFYETVETGIVHLEDLHYEMPLPFKHKNTQLPNNYSQEALRPIRFLNFMNQNPEIDGRYFLIAENRNQKSGLRKSENGKRKSKIRNQKTEIRNEKSEIRNPKSEIIRFPSASSSNYQFPADRKFAPP